jgi:hypothetical protein
MAVPITAHSPNCQCQLTSSSDVCKAGCNASQHSSRCTSCAAISWPRHQHCYRANGDPIAMQSQSPCSRQVPPSVHPPPYTPTNPAGCGGRHQCLPYQPPPGSIHTYSSKPTTCPSSTQHASVRPSGSRRSQPHMRPPEAECARLAEQQPSCATGRLQSVRHTAQLPTAPALPKTPASTTTPERHPYMAEAERKLHLQG